jgi:hypothetical protein
MNGLIFLFSFILFCTFLVWQAPDSYDYLTHGTWFVRLLAYAYVIAHLVTRLILLTHT